MSLTDIKIPDSVTTGYENPVDDFFIPVLKHAVRYDIAVGYFTSGWLKDTAEGFAEFALSGGRSRWIVSVNLNKDDADVIFSKDKNTAHDLFERNLFEMIKSLQSDARAELCALISAGTLQFKIAIPRNSTGMLHAKIGVATDRKGNKAGFSGSYNLTASAKTNWEHIDVFKNWEHGEKKRIDNLENRFNNLWNNADRKYEVFIPSDKLLSLIEVESDKKLKNKIDSVVSNKDKSNIILRDYQLRAIEKWGKNDGRGTYKMATGSGKTITALSTIKKLISLVVDSKKKPLAIVIVVPLKHLLDQWHQECKDFGYEPIKCYEKSSTWRKKLAERMGILRVTGNGYIIVLVTNATFSKSIFQDEIQKIDIDFMIVADEAHNLGSATYLKALPQNANFRLSLSATPDRYNDIGGTKALYAYFGEAVIDFTLKDAIQLGYLTPYKYYPHLCLMTEDEYVEYLEIQKLIIIEGKKTDSGGNKTKKYLSLIGQRSDFISGINSKLDKLEELLILQKTKEDHIQHTLVYCGSRRGASNERHIERTVKLIGKLGIKARKFTADETMRERREILDLFSMGELEAIAAIRCLDEGVDVPATRVAYILASTANPREYIQRRGRVLRKSKGKNFAVIHDFLVAPPSESEMGDDMIIRELERAHTFSDIAMNKDECGQVLEKLDHAYGMK